MRQPAAPLRAVMVARRFLLPVLLLSAGALTGCGKGSSPPTEPLSQSPPTQADPRTPPTYELAWGGLGDGDGMFNYPQGVATDIDGNVYVSDNNCVQKFSADGAFITKWGSRGTGNGQFKSPYGVAAGNGGSVYVSEFIG